MRSIVAVSLTTLFMGCQERIAIHESAVSPIHGTDSRTREFVYPPPSIRITVEEFTKQAMYWQLVVWESGNEPVSVYGTASNTIETVRCDPPYQVIVQTPVPGIRQVRLLKDGATIFGFTSQVKDQKAVIEYGW